MKKLIFFPGKANKKREEIESFGSSVIRYVPVERILPNPFHSRKNCDGEAIIRLADSIKRYGIIEPIGVRRFTAGKYELVFGERRLCAAKLADVERVPCIILENITRKTSCELNYIENIMREPFDIHEKADSIETLLRRFDMSDDEICRNLSVYRDEMRFLLDVQRLTSEEKRLASSCKLTSDQLRHIMKIDNIHVRKHLMRIICEKGIPASGCERFVDEFMKGTLHKKEMPEKEKKQPPKAIRRLVLGDLRVFTNSVDRAVEVVRSSGAAVECVKNMADNGVSYTISVLKPGKV